jgi:hypothetical protein
MLQNDELVAKVASALLRGELFEQAGELYEKVNQTEKAFDCYRKAQAFPRAIELARIISPSGSQLFTPQENDSCISKSHRAGSKYFTIRCLIINLTGQWLRHFQEPQICLSLFYCDILYHFSQF